MKPSDYERLATGAMLFIWGVLVGFVVGHALAGGFTG